MGILHFPKIAAEGLVFYFDGKNPKSYTSPNTYLDDLINKRRLSAFRNSSGITYSDDALVFGNSANDFYSYTGMTCAYNPMYLNKPNTSAFVTFYNTANSVSGTPAWYRQTPFAFGTDSTTGGWQFEKFAGGTEFYFRHHHDQSGIYGDQYLIGSVSLNTWYQLGYVNNGKDTILYLNGVEVNRYDSAGFTLTNPTTTALLTIGAAGNVDIIYGFVGKVAQAMFYQKALSTGEVKQNYEFMRRRYKL
jgi:hypothetical protein